METLVKFMKMYELRSATLFACFIFCFLSFTESLIQTDSETQTARPNDSELKISELQRRKEIAENYMNTLEKAKETWVDPYEMMSSPLKERQVFTKSADESTIKSIYNLNSDEEPLFSDIKGEIIGSKTSKVSDVEDNTVVSGGHFAKDRQQNRVYDSIYISRWLKMLILKVEKDSNSDPSSVTFPLDATMLANLKELSTAKSLEISQLDELVSSMLAQASVSKKEEFDWTILFDIAKYICWGVLIGSALLFSMCFFCLCCKYRPILTSAVVFCCINIFWHWMHLYQQKTASKHAELSSMKFPDECRKHDFGFFEHVKHYFQSFFKSDECVKYHEALLVDPMWEVSISVAVSEALTSVLLQPLSVMSRVLNISWKQLFDGMSWETRICFYVFLFLSLMMAFKYRIKLPFFFGAFEPHYPVGSRVENIATRKTLLASSKEKARKVVQYIQCRDPLQIQPGRNLDGNLPDMPKKNPQKCVLYSSKPVGVNWKPKRSRDCGHPGYSEVCENSREDNESGNDSEEVGSDIEKPVEQCEHCSCCISSADVQYLHEDCKVCSSEENRNAVMSTSKEDGAVSECPNCSVDKNLIDDFYVVKSNSSTVNRTSKTIEPSACCGVTNHIKDGGDP